MSGLQIFMTIGIAVVAAAFVALRNRGDQVGWWIGFGHGLLALVGLGGLSAAHDSNFAVSMAILTAYAGAMCITEGVRRFRAPRSV
jgi:hypothetical protein